MMYIEQVNNLLTDKKNAISAVPYNSLVHARKL